MISMFSTLTLLLLLGLACIVPSTFSEPADARSLNTNAKRFTAGLPPLPPKRHHSRNTLLRRPATTSVFLRIEGSTNTIYEGLIDTAPRDNVTTASGGMHRCDGTNAGANPTSGPTCTTALADAAAHASWSFDGTYNTNFDDFFITRISTTAQTSTQFWGLLLNFQFTPVSGCQQQVAAGDSVLWGFDAYNKVYFLKLAGPQSANVGQAVALTVTDGSSGVVIAGASVCGKTTGADGKVSCVFATPGSYSMKATRADSLRSNALTISVGSGGQTEK